MQRSKVHERCEVDSAGDFAAAAAADRAAGPAVAAGGSPSLECLSNTVGEEKKGEEFHIVGDRCRSWFCPHCAKIQGPRLRGKLIDRVTSWQSPMMLTFTIDPDLFDSAESAFEHVTQQRALAHVMRELKAFLASPGYFSVIEWQENGWPHWHVLCDAVRIPIVEVRKAWAKFVPANMRHLIRPRVAGLGIVRFSKPGWCKSAKHAALYVSKYLTKFPDKGFPEWVMQAKYRIRRYSTSRGFWGELTHRTACASADDETEPEKESVGHFIKKQIRKRGKRSHSQRLGVCCTSCTVYRVTGAAEIVDKTTGEVKQKPVRQFFRKLVCQPFALAGIVRDFMREVPELPAFIRGAFIQWRTSWAVFVELFGGQVERAMIGKLVAMRL